MSISQLSDDDKSELLPVSLILIVLLSIQIIIHTYGILVVSLNTFFKNNKGCGLIVNRINYFFQACRLGSLITINVYWHNFEGQVCFCHSRNFFLEHCRFYEDKESKQSYTCNMQSKDQAYYDDADAKTRLLQCISNVPYQEVYGSEQYKSSDNLKELIAGYSFFELNNLIFLLLLFEWSVFAIKALWLLNGVKKSKN